MKTQKENSVYLNNIIIRTSHPTSACKEPNAVTK
jgi:hypothetical protein